MTAPTLTQAQVALVQSTFRKVLPMQRLAAELFYARLFQIAPETEALFKGSMEEQGEKLMATLLAVVDNLGDIDLIVPTAKDLAARHVTYGVTPKHYDLVGAALLWTLEKALDGGWTDKAAEAWDTAYTTLSTLMVDTAYARADADPVAAE